MKKRTKVSLRTKIYLTLVGLLALTGVLYASNPSVFVTPGHGVDQPIGFAAHPNHLLLSPDNDQHSNTGELHASGHQITRQPNHDGRLLRYRHVVRYTSGPYPSPVDGEINGYRSSAVRG